MPDSWSSSRVDLHLVPGEGGRRSGLESALREAVRDGRLAAGSLLPSTRGLAADLGLSRGTVTAAYDQLAAEGYLTIRPGSGTRVADVPPPPMDAPEVVLQPPPLHDLRPGRPDVNAFPRGAWLAATRRVLAGADPSVFGAGDPQGRIELRVALADYLGRTRGVQARPELIVVTSGYHQALSLLGRVLHDQGIRRSAYEDPGHNHYRGVVERAGLTTVPLPVDERGAQPEALTNRLGAAFLTPSHQYPLGVPLHPSRRQVVCAWARRTGGLVVEDDYDGEFRYDRQPVGALQGIATEHVVYGGTVSKTLGPALRLGWMVLPPDLVKPFVQAKEEADLYTETLGQLVLADLMATHAYDRHVRAARLRYRKRRMLLNDRLPLQGVPAGLSALVLLDNEEALLAACAERGLALRGLTELHHSPENRPQGLLIGFAAPSDRGYPRALDVLCEVLAGARPR
ncbi:PLP-dependent aminotransferase family protein [Actinomadura barringtoniae]|uniref:PLP-dependent aminotransferase family protein n=1 Tax=Actinomadura barringtoniae TaxID=1427535 RepID=A0A939PL10_9ACTN|nr:PLP-dependent aminotransferase family protein [Actinomadura barringtoniae]MBO2451099.1 PLP-dependent aminotransferase family protein [Actinomadura barringtoniae]